MLELCGQQTTCRRSYSRRKQFPDSRSASSSSSFFFSLCLPFCISATETSVSHICSWSSGTMTGTMHGCERVSYENHWLSEFFLLSFTVESVWSCGNWHWKSGRGDSKPQKEVDQYSRMNGKKKVLSGWANQRHQTQCHLGSDRTCPMVLNMFTGYKWSFERRSAFYEFKTMNILQDQIAVDWGKEEL